MAIAAGQQLGPCIAVPCSVWINCYPPDRRRRDLDNILKGALDSLVHAKAILDDSLIDELHVLREQPKAPGHVRILIRKMEATK